MATSCTGYRWRDAGALWFGDHSVLATRQYCQSVRVCRAPGSRTGLKLIFERSCLEEQNKGLKTRKTIKRRVQCYLASGEIQKPIQNDETLRDMGKPTEKKRRRLRLCKAMRCIRQSRTGLLGRRYGEEHGMERVDYMQTLMLCPKYLQLDGPQPF